MLFHIPCLKLLLFLCVVAFPSAYIYFAKPFINISGSRLLSENAATVLIYGVLTLIAWLSGIDGVFAGFAVKGITQGWICIMSAAAILAFANLAVEYLEASLPFLIRNRKLPSVRPAAIYSVPSVRLADILSIVLAAAAEEVIFRQVIIGAICTGLGWDIWAGIVAGSFLYGMNHVYFGRFSVVQKFSSGLVYSVLFVVSGSCIWPSILCHALQNILLYCWSVRKIKHKNKAITSSDREEAQNE